MPEKVDECVESVLDDNPEMDESTAFAICNAQLKSEGDPVETLLKAAAELHDDTEEKADDDDEDELTDDVTTKSATVSGDFGLVSLKATAAGIDEETVEKALDADEFILYGKANIEHKDDDGDVLDMDTLETALDRYFESTKAPGIISIGHDDVPVGIPKREHELAEDTTINIDGESHEFGAGETIETHAADNDGDGNPELWLVADLANDNPPAEKTRMQALSGELNGFSVTVSKSPNGGSGGKDGVAALHAVTIGTDEQIKNEGSEFDVAEFKARFGLADDATVEAVVEEIEQVIDEVAR